MSETRIKFAILDGSGLVVSTGIAQAEAVPEGAVSLAWASDLATIARGYFVDGIWQARPAAPALQETGPNTWRLPECPAGTVLTIADCEDGTVLIDGPVSGDVDFQLVDPGQYQVELIPPVPFLPFVGVISC